MQHIPAQAKAVAVKRLQNANVSAFHKQEFAKIIDFINGGVEIDGKILRMKVEDLDWKRSVDLRTHHSELAQAIDYNGPQR